MTTHKENPQRAQHDLESGAAMAIGVALSCCISPGYGIPIGIVLFLAAQRDKKKMTASEVVRLAVITLVVVLSVTSFNAIINDWAGFKSGFSQGYQSYAGR